MSIINLKETNYVQDEKLVEDQELFQTDKESLSETSLTTRVNEELFKRVENIEDVKKGYEDWLNFGREFHFTEVHTTGDLKLTLIAHLFPRSVSIKRTSARRPSSSDNFLMFAEDNLNICYQDDLTIANV